MKKILYFLWQFVPVFLLAQSNPLPHKLTDYPYAFTEWNENAPSRSYPNSMIFHTCKKQDPKLEDEMTGDWISPYNLKSKARINGLGDLGFSFLITSSTQDGDAYPGAAVLALDTRGCTDVFLSWTARTIKSNDRNYSIYVQYRIDTNAQFTNLANVFYNASKSDGDFKEYKNIKLPQECSDKSYVQVRWKYCYENDGSTGGRPQLAVDDIIISKNIIQNINKSDNQIKMRIIGNILQFQNANGYELKIFDLLGKVIFQNRIEKDFFEFQLENFFNGVYFLALQKGNYSLFEKVVIN